MPLPRLQLVELEDLTLLQDLPITAISDVSLNAPY
jgi:hypothetical protein